MPIARRPDPTIASATAGGVLLEPVNGSVPPGGALPVVGADDVDEVVGAVVVVDSSATGVVVDVEPRPVTGVVAVDVVGPAVVGVVVVGATVVVGAIVVVGAAVDDGAAVLVGAAVVVGAMVLVGETSVQSDRVACACAEPVPSVDDHESVALTTCVPVARVRATASLMSDCVKVKSRSTTVLPSTTIVSCAVVDVPEKFW
jgi:hypothetical protein